MQFGSWESGNILLAVVPCRVDAGRSKGLLYFHALNGKAIDLQKTGIRCVAINESMCLTLAGSCLAGELPPTRLQYQAFNSCDDYHDGAHYFNLLNL